MLEDLIFIKWRLGIVVIKNKMREKLKCNKHPLVCKLKYEITTKYN